MESMKCMNEGCHKTSVCWKRGWQLKSGAFALLCLACGVAYDDSSYCSSFHKEENGWRECKFCNVPIHCGCIASEHLHETLDAGGVGCKKCNIDTELRLTTAIPNWSIGIGSSSRLGPLLDNEQVNLQPQNADQGPFDLGKNKNCEISGSSLNPPTIRPSILSRPGSGSGGTSLGNFLDSVNRQSSDFPISSSSSTLNNAPTHANSPVHFTGKTARGANRNCLKKPVIHPNNIPTMTELELVQYSKALNSEIVPLFQKTLCITDVSKNGRFTVPKACAKTYFPAIKKLNGVPIQMLDIKNRKWEFQLKFMPSHSDRTYYLDGARPFLLNLQLQALDTVTFSRMVPSRTLVIGYRYCNVTNIEDFPINQQNQEPSAESSSSWRVNVNIASDSVENTPPNIEKSKIPSNKRARKGKESMIPTMSWKQGQELLRAPVTRNRVIVMVDSDEIEEYEVPPVIGAEPTPVSTSGHRGRCSRRKLQMPLKWDWGRFQSGSGSTSGSAQLPADANGETTAQLPAEANEETTAQLHAVANGEMTGPNSDGRNLDLNLPCEIQDDNDLEFSDSEGIIAPKKI